MFKKFIAFFISFCFAFEQLGFAQIAGQLDISSRMTSMYNSMVFEKYRPLHLRYLSYDQLNNDFKLLLDKGSARETKPELLEKTTGELLKYFFIGIALPDDAFWVNLRPDSPREIIDDNLAKTDIGRIMLECDLQLKKDTAKYTSPETLEGREYWDKLYKRAEELYGSENITIPTLTRPWIVPDEIIVREAQGAAYIYKATLKVMLEQDYLKGDAQYSFPDEKSKILNEYSSQIIRETIIPKLTREVNSSKRYAPLRQVYYSLILAQWFKKSHKDTKSQVTSKIDTKDLTNLTSKTKWDKDGYFKAYQKSFKDGEYNIQETRPSASGQTIRSYFSGGTILKTTIVRYGDPQADPQARQVEITSTNGNLPTIWGTTSLAAITSHANGDVAIENINNAGSPPDNTRQPGSSAPLNDQQKDGVLKELLNALNADRNSSSKDVVLAALKKLNDAKELNARPQLDDLKAFIQKKLDRQEIAAMVWGFSGFAGLFAAGMALVPNYALFDLLGLSLLIPHNPILIVGGFAYMIISASLSIKSFFAAAKLNNLSGDLSALEQEPKALDFLDPGKAEKAGPGANNLDGGIETVDDFVKAFRGFAENERFVRVDDFGGEKEERVTLLEDMIAYATDPKYDHTGKAAIETILTFFYITVIPPGPLRKELNGLYRIVSERTYQDPQTKQYLNDLYGGSDASVKKKAMKSLLFVLADAMEKAGAEQGFKGGRIETVEDFVKAFRGFAETGKFVRTDVFAGQKEASETSLKDMIDYVTDPKYDNTGKKAIDAILTFFHISVIPPLGIRQELYALYETTEELTYQDPQVNKYLNDLKTGNANVKNEAMKKLLSVLADAMANVRPEQGLRDGGIADEIDELAIRDFIRARKIDAAIFLKAREGLKCVLIRGRGNSDNEANIKNDAAALKKLFANESNQPSVFNYKTHKSLPDLSPEEILGALSIEIKDFKNDFVVLSGLEKDDPEVSLALKIRRQLFKEEPIDIYRVFEGSTGSDSRWESEPDNAGGQVEIGKRGDGNGYYVSWVLGEETVVYREDFVSLFKGETGSAVWDQANEMYRFIRDNAGDIIELLTNMKVDIKDGKIDVKQMREILEALTNKKAALEDEKRVLKLLDDLTDKKAALKQKQMRQILEALKRAQADGGTPAKYEASYQGMQQYYRDKCKAISAYATRFELSLGQFMSETGLSQGQAAGALARFAHGEQYSGILVSFDTTTGQLFFMNIGSGRQDDTTLRMKSSVWEPELAAKIRNYSSSTAKYEGSYDGIQKYYKDKCKAISAYATRFEVPLGQFLKETGLSQSQAAGALSIFANGEQYSGISVDFDATNGKVFFMNIGSGRQDETTLRMRDSLWKPQLRAKIDNYKLSGSGLDGGLAQGSDNIKPSNNGAQKYPSSEGPRTTGGIDFRALPITTQPMGEMLMKEIINMPAINIADLDREWQSLQKMIEASACPSTQRIKEFLGACYQKGELRQRSDKVLACLAGILRMEEDECKATEPQIKVMLALLEYNR